MWDDIQFVEGYGWPVRAMSCAWKNDQTLVDGIKLPSRTQVVTIPGPTVSPAVPWNRQYQTKATTAPGSSSDSPDDDGGLDNGLVNGDELMSVGGSFSSAPPASYTYTIVTPRGLPGRIIWLGFLTDTALFTLMSAAAWMGIVAIPRLAIRWIRMHRHLCLSCGYPIGASAMCTECGAFVKPRSAAKATGTAPSH